MLLVDIGNTRLKWRLHKLDANGQPTTTVQQRGSIATKELSTPALTKAMPANAKTLCFASVADKNINALLVAWAAKQQLNYQQVQTQQQWQDLTNAYADVTRMGVDRWLVMVAVRQLNQAAICVIDCGSATTVDFIAANGQHEGGYIIPGQRLMVQSLISDTAQIDFLDQEAQLQNGGYGINTAGAVIQGSKNLHQAGINAIAEQALRAGYKVYATGGDGKFLAQNQAINYIEELVLDGLWASLYDESC